MTKEQQRKCYHYLKKLFYQEGDWNGVVVITNICNLIKEIEANKKKIQKKDK